MTGSRSSAASSLALRAGDARDDRHPLLLAAARAVAAARRGGLAGPGLRPQQHLWRLHGRAEFAARREGARRALAAERDHLRGAPELVKAAGIARYSDGDVR